MQIALSEIQNFCSESQKLHYSDLLSLAEDFDEDAKYQVGLGREMAKARVSEIDF